MLPIKAKYLVVIYILVEVFAVASQSGPGIAHFAHLGGGVVGFLYVYFIMNKGKPMQFKDQNKTSNVFDNFKDMFEKKKKEEEPPAYKRPANIYDANFEDMTNSKYEDDLRRDEKETVAKIDAILDKLSANGYGSLTDEEKRILFQESKKLR